MDVDFTPRRWVNRLGRERWQPTLTIGDDIWIQAKIDTVYGGYKSWYQTKYLRSDTTHIKNRFKWYARLKAWRYFRTTWADHYWLDEE